MYPRPCHAPPPSGSLQSPTAEPPAHDAQPPADPSSHGRHGYELQEMHHRPDRRHHLQDHDEDDDHGNCGDPEADSIAEPASQRR